MTVRRILEEPLIVNGAGSRTERQRRIHEVLEEVRLTPVQDFLSKFPHMLSGGQQQRVVIARAHDPAAEAAGGRRTGVDARRLGREWRYSSCSYGLQRAHDLGVIYITHDLSSVRHFSDRIFVMYAAKIIEKAGGSGSSHTTLSILTRGRCSRRYRIPMPKMPPPSKLCRRASRRSLVQPPSGCRFHPRCPDFMKGLCEVKDPPEFEPRPAISPCAGSTIRPHESRGHRWPSDSRSSLRVSSCPFSWLCGFLESAWCYLAHRNHFSSFVGLVWLFYGVCDYTIRDNGF